MEIFKIYLEHSLDLVNGITAFSVLQSLAFIYWSQSNEFKDNVKWGTLVRASFNICLYVPVLLRALPRRRRPGPITGAFA